MACRPGALYGPAVHPRLEQAVRILKHPLLASAAVLVVGLWGTAYYAGVVNKIYPIDGWLFWSLAKLWGWMLVFSAACVAMGQLILDRLLRVELPPLESAVQAMAVGVVAFVMCMYAGGALGWFGPVYAVVLPLAFVAAGGRAAWRLLARIRLELARPRKPSPFVWLVSAAGVVCVALVYLGAMTPDSLNYDSTWSHLVIAQDYARHGRIVPWLANYNMGVPHLASLIHTWGWTVPGLDHPALRWMMALHNEFGLFLWTLAGVQAGVRRLTDEPELRAAWTSFFLFPIIFVYDNNLGGAADHIAAFFAVPMLLAALDVFKSFGAGSAALLAITAAGGLLTKYQVAYQIVSIAAMLGVRWLWLVIRRKQRRVAEADAAIGWRELVRAPLIVVGLGALLVSPHFLKNAIFYNNPFYPFAMDVFRNSYPSYPGASWLIRYNFTDDNWIPKGTTLQKLLYATELFFDFSFEPHYSFTKNVPSMGSLFTLLLPLVFFVRNAGKIAFAAVVASGAVFIWAYTYNLDRNIQIPMPILVCVTAALIVRGWQLGWLARAGIVPLLLFQIVWGGDALFYSSHDRIRSAMDLIRSGYEGNAVRRFDGYRSTFLTLRKVIPENARVLLHTSHVTLGIDREVIQDWQAFQGYINYEPIKSVRQLYDYYRERGITHILWEPGARPSPTKQEEVLFQGFVSRYAKLVGDFGSYRLMSMPSEPPPPEDAYRVVTVGLGNYKDGLYPIQALRTNEYLPGYLQRYASPDRPLPRRGEARAALLATADAVFVGPRARLDRASDALLKEQFVAALHHGFTLYLRKVPN